MKSIDELELVTAARESYPLPEPTETDKLRASLEACRRQNETLSRQLVRTLMLREEQAPTLHAVGYESLAEVLARAFAQASAGKGSERHATGQPFHTQPMQQLCRLYGPGFALGQAAKKAQESQRLPTERAVAELLGAINYLAGAVIHIEASAKQ